MYAASMLPNQRDCISEVQLTWISTVIKTLFFVSVFRKKMKLCKASTPLVLQLTLVGAKTDICVGHSVTSGSTPKVLGLHLEVS